VSGGTGLTGIQLSPGLDERADESPWTDERIADVEQRAENGDNPNAGRARRELMVAELEGHVGRVEESE
jgi:hypothetical protein